MKPTIKQLEALYWAGKLGSFQAAAAHLHTSQSAIAKRIAELREIFQVRLIDPAYRHAKRPTTDSVCWPRPRRCCMPTNG